MIRCDYTGKVIVNCLSSVTFNYIFYNNQTLSIGTQRSSDISLTESVGQTKYVRFYSDPLPAYIWLQHFVRQNY